MLAATLFSIAFALFLGVCAVVHFLTEPREELGCDGTNGDWPHLPGDLKSTLFHDTQNSRGGQ
jgi:hypothetical protein